MSQFYWQNALQATPLQYGSSQDERNDDGSQWSYVGLTNDSANDKPQQQQPYWWSQQIVSFDTFFHLYK